MIRTAFVAVALFGSTALAGDYGLHVTREAGASCRAPTCATAAETLAAFEAYLRDQPYDQLRFPFGGLAMNGFVSWESATARRRMFDGLMRLPLAPKLAKEEDWLALTTWFANAESVGDIERALAAKDIVPAVRRRYVRLEANVRKRAETQRARRLPH